MNTNKMLLAGLGAGVAYFIGGFLVYGLLLKDFFEGQMTSGGLGIMKDPMVMWAIALGNLVFGFFLAFIFSQWGGIKTFAGGAKGGAIIGFLIALSVDLMTWSMMDVSSFTSVLIDPIVNAVISAFAGGVAGWILGRGQA